MKPLFILNVLGLTICLLFSVNLANAATITSARTGNWSAGAWPNTSRIGTITTSTANANVTGTGTYFLNEISIGNIIKTTGNVIIGTVLSITDDTHLILTTNAASTNTNIYYRFQGVGPGDDVIIAANHIVTVNGNFLCTNLSIGSNNNIATLTFAASGAPSLEVSGAVTLGNAGNANRRGAIAFTRGSILTAGSLTLGVVANQASTITMTAGGTLSVAGSITTSGAGAVWTPGTGTVELTGTNTLPGTIFTVFNNLSITSGTTTFSAGTTINGTLSISGTGVVNLGVITSYAGLLRFTGVDQVNGSWGYTGSGATNINTLYFGNNTGILYVADIWTGTISTDWNVSGNWSSGVPASATSIVIPSVTNQPVIGAAGGVCHDIIVLSGATLTISGSNTLTIGGNWTNNGSFSPNTGTVIYNDASQTVAAVTYYNLNFSGTGTKSSAGAITLNGALVIGDDVTFSHGGYNLTVTGTTTVGGGTSGSLSFTSATGTKLFTGLVTIGSGGSWNNTTANSAVSFAGGITNNGTFNPGTGVQTFQTNSQALNGTFSIPSVTVTGAAVMLTNNNILTVGTALSGTGGLIQAVNGVLNIGGTSVISTLTATATGNTVNYTDAAQTVRATSYYDLTLSGSGIKTTTTVTVANVLSMEGTATASVVPAYGASATLQYNTATSRTAGVEWLTPFAATGGVRIANTGIITLNAAKVFNASIPLTINSGATLATNNFQLTLGGNFVNGGTFTAGSSPIVIANTMATQSISGFTTTGTVSMTKTAGTATFMSNVNGGGLTINGTGGGLNLGSGLTHTFTGVWTRTAGTLNGGSSILKLGSSVTNTAGTFTAGTGTVEYYANGTQTAGPLIYNNLTLTGTNAKTFPAGTTTVNGILSMEGTATTTLTGTLSFGGSATLQYKGSGAQITGAEFPASWSGSGGVKIENPNGVTLNSAKNINTNPFVIGSVVEGSMFNDGGFQLTGTGTLTFTSGTFKLGSGTATTYPAFITNNITAGTTVDYAATTSQTIKGLNNYSNLTISGTGANSKTANGDITVNGILNLVSANASATAGCLSMSTYTLNMGAAATTTGTGDVTGIVRRTSFAPGIPYSFGNQFTTLTIASGGTMPADFSFKIVIGSAPSWKSSAVQRSYDIIRTGGSGATVTLILHYLDNELQSNTESNLVIWDYHSAETPPVVEEHGKSGQSTTDNWIAFSNRNITTFGTVFNDHQWGLSDKEAGDFVWQGTPSSDWNDPDNWSGGIIPVLTSDIQIPDASKTLHDPLLPTGPAAFIKTINLAVGGILEGGTSTIFTIAGSTGAWINQGIFNSGTSTVIFTNAVASLAGITDFYNVTIGTGAGLTPGSGSVMRLAGILTLEGTGVLNSAVFSNTIEYNGANQTVINPNGLTPGYDNLILSGSGTKTLPANALDVYGDFSISGTASANLVGSVIVGGNLTIENGSLLSVSPAINLTVTGTFINNAGTPGFVLQSDASGTASLIHNTDNVPATIQRFISGAAEAWHFLSSPVKNQSISGSWLPSGTYGNLTGYDLYLWNEPNSCWIYKLDITSPVNWNTVHPGTEFVPGRGYLYSVQAANPTKEFTGILNNGSLNYELSFSGTDVTLKGFNLAGNPYPSAIDWYASSGWTRSDLVSSGSGYDMWIWNPDANNYGVYNSSDPGGVGTNSITRFIAPMQGYFVQTSAGGILEVDNMARVSESTSGWFKGKGMNLTGDNKVSLSVKSEEGYGSDEILLRFGYPQNEGGAMKLFSRVLTAPSLFMTNGKKQLSVCYFTDSGENPVVPVAFSSGVNGNYTISCNFDESKYDIVMLEDRQKHFIQNLKQKNTYSFQSSTSDNANRFVLHFGPGNSSEKAELPARIFNDGYQTIIDLTLVSKATDLYVYDILGRLLLQQKLQGETKSSIILNTGTQIVIFCLRNPDGSFYRKLVWTRK
jgi:hypothetical protein